MSYDKCNMCGMCKANCPVYLIVRKETKSPRSKLLLLKENMINEHFDDCLMCGACKQDCPSEVDVPKEVKKARVQLIEGMQETEENKTLIKNLRDKGNIYGI
jgi:Fe-S oxidoreductase